MSDLKLAQSPIVVVGRWNGTPLTAHKRVEGDVVKEFEGRTELLVERVIEGDVKQGELKILLFPFVGWEEDGRIMSYTSSEMAGDVNDVSKPNLWFLSQKRSWDKTDPILYLSLDTYRGVQPLVLEPYFKALRAKDPRTTVPTLLSSHEPEVVIRTLKFICGDDYPNDLGTGFLIRPADAKRDRKPLVDQATNVEALLESKDAPVRRMAAWAFADLNGKAAVPRMRRLLADPDAHVRAVAIAALARQEDVESIEPMRQTAAGIEGIGGCRVVEALAEWKSDRAVPVLISMLQTNSDENGNLKETGKLLNGKKYGLWTYYNEGGDRIRSEDGGSTATYNPNHPDNKGLGKRKP